MIDEKILLVEKLKDNAIEFLGQKMIEDIGSGYKEQQKIIEQKLLDWVTWARQYYSTTEIKKAYSILLKEHGSIYTMVRPEIYIQINALDEWLDLSEPNILFNSQHNKHSIGLGKYSNPLYNKKINAAPNTQKTYKKPMTLRQIIKTLRNNKPCMRKLKRKETKLKKKGIRLFDSP
jgi:hypothetical protein